MEMGSPTYFSDLVHEQGLVHDYDTIVTCNMKDLLGKNNETPEVEIISNFFICNFKTDKIFCIKFFWWLSDFHPFMDEYLQ